MASPLTLKVQAVRDFPQPQFQRHLHRFVGIVNFYHRFLPYWAELMQPLHSLLSSSKSKSQTLTWTDSATVAFNVTKDALANASLLSYPQPDSPPASWEMPPTPQLELYYNNTFKVHGIQFPSFPGRWLLLRLDTAQCIRPRTTRCLSLNQTLQISPRRSTISCFDWSQIPNLCSQLSFWSTFTTTNSSIQLHCSIYLHHPSRTMSW